MPIHHWYWEHYTEASGKPARGTAEVHLSRSSDNAIIYVVFAEAELLDTDVNVMLYDWLEIVDPGDDPIPTLQTAIRKRDAAWETVVRLTPQLVKIKEERRKAVQHFWESYGFVQDSSGRWRQKERLT